MDAASDDKMTKEAAELLDVFQAKERGDDNAFKLVMAQVAPSVRYAAVVATQTVLLTTIYFMIVG
jgi:hypothetical protein